MAPEADRALDLGREGVLAADVQVDVDGVLVWAWVAGALEDQAGLAGLHRVQSDVLLPAPADLDAHQRGPEHRQGLRVDAVDDDGVEPEAT